MKVIIFYSIRKVVCHGIPNTRILNEGDSINVDVTNYFKGQHGDSSVMIYINKPHPEIKRLGDVTREAMFDAIKICKPGQKFSKIGQVIQEYVMSRGFYLVSEFTGHGVGKNVHMLPSVYHIGNNFNKNNLFLANQSEEVMKEGLAFTIEPIVCLKPYSELYIFQDNWSIFLPQNPSAQWEHTILITNTGHEILTKRENEKFPQNYYV